MNKKQQIILLLGIITIALIVIFTPRYKLTWINSDNFVKTEQASTLYKRSTGTVKLHWDKIAIYSSIPFFICGILMVVLMDRKERN